ncbi:ATP-binding protein [Malonomonas rubra]|uniref:ATP-binding protein n=1 Tax=Malonomonas rubra TaxID=57040 RepID=UPI0026EE4F3A|nr:ATP-binding protein [Malonomonas rubra]
MLSIRQRFLILQCATIVATTLFLGALSYSLFIPVIFKLQTNELEHTSREAAQSIDSYLHSLIQTLEGLDLEGFHQRYGDLPLEEVFVRHFTVLSDSFPLISYLDKDGNETVRLVNSRPSEYFFNQKQTPVVARSLAKPNQVQVGISQRSAGFDKPALQLAVTKIGYFGDEFIGTLLITIPLEELLQLFDKILLHVDDGNLTLLDHKQIISQKDGVPIFSTFTGQLPKNPQRLEYLDNDVFFAAEVVKLTGWQVVSTRPYATFIEELTNLKLLAGLTCILVTVLSGALSTRVVRHLTRNISLLIEHAGKVGSGDYDHYLELYQDRDFEKLGEAINAMTQDIARARNSRESLQQILESIIDPLVVADQQGILKQVNHATLELFACEENNLLGKPLADLFPNPPQTLTEASFASALLRRRVTNLETQVETAQGQRVTVLFSSSPVPGRNIDMGVVGTIKNIDELVNARILREHALREAEDAHRRIDALLKSVADGLIVTDLSCKVLSHNSPAEKLLGAPGQPLFKKVLDSLPDPTQLESMPPFDIDLPATENSPHRIIQVHSSPVLDHRGSQTGIVSVLRDVTRERALEQIKTEFISTAAHELTTPLTSILGYSELLLDREMEAHFSVDQKRDFMEEILNRSESLSKIVDDLLNISRIESGQPIPLDIQPTEVGALLRRTINNFQLASDQHRFDIDLPERQQHPALADKARFVQVLENLLSNAVKYSPGNTHISVSGASVDNIYKITITDQGIGMTEEQLGRIFDKFYRCDSSNTAVGGLGLGMSIVKQIVDDHQGSIQVESTLGQGTTVTLRLPLAT